jgi:surfactin synthase thioesterase subunit
MTTSADGSGATAGSGQTRYLTSRPDASDGLRLFCFPHAGGGASVFADWQASLGPRIAALPVQLPGRERRVHEPRFTDMGALVADLDRQLDPYLDQPCVFYGHSMGALVAWNLMVLRASAGRRLPDALLVGACNPPHLPPVSTGTRGMSRDRLIQWLLDIGGISAMVLKYPEWVDAAISLLRDDLMLCDSHDVARFRDAPPLAVPIHAFAGSDDAAIGAGVLAGWARHTSLPSAVRTVPGGHLFFRDSPAEFLSSLRAALTQLVAGPHVREALR